MNPAGRTVKVLVSGAFSTGKTTALRRLRDAAERAGLNAAVTVEAARRCPFPLNREQDAHTSAWLLGDLIRQESETLSTHGIDLLLCDGGPPDVLAHSEVDRVAGIDLVTRLCAAWQPTYDLVFWSRPVAGWPIERDDLRLEDDAYREEVDRAVGRALRALLAEARELPAGTDERVGVMLDAIREATPFTGG